MFAIPHTYTHTLASVRDIVAKRPTAILVKTASPRPHFLVNSELILRIFFLFFFFFGKFDFLFLQYLFFIIKLPLYLQSHVEFGASAWWCAHCEAAWIARSCAPPLPAVFGPLSIQLELRCFLRLWNLADNLPAMKFCNYRGLNSGSN